MHRPDRLTVTLSTLSTALFLFGCGDSSTNGSGGAGGHSSSSSSSSSSATSSSSSDHCGNTCGSFTCCGTSCVNPQNDIKNCGLCGITCLGPDPYCDHGNCGEPPCDPS